MVPTPVPSQIRALVGLLRITVRVSLPSKPASLVIGTVIVFVVSPGANVSVPLAAVKSVPDVAVPLAVVYATVELSVASPVRVTVKVIVPAPSLTVTSFTVKSGRSSLVPPAPVPSSLMVPTPVASLMRALVAADRLRSKVSVPSKTLLLPMLMVTVLLVSLAAKLSVPLAAS